MYFAQTSRVEAPSSKKEAEPGKLDKNALMPLREMPVRGKPPSDTVGGRDAAGEGEEAGTGTGFCGIVGMERERGRRGESTSGWAEG